MFHARRILLPVFFSVSVILSLTGCDQSSTSSTSSTSSVTPAPAATTGSSTPPVGSAVATVTWVTPALPANSAASRELLGYHIYYGTSPGALTHTADVTDPTTSSYEIKNLASGMWYFAVATYDASEAESPRSAPVGAML